MPLIAPTNDVSESALREMEPSTVLVEIKRVEQSISKLNESNAALKEFAGSDATQADKTMYEGVVRENEGVIERQSSLLKRLQSELEAKGGAHVAAASDPHLAASAHTSTVQGDLTARADRIVNDRDEF